MNYQQFNFRIWCKGWKPPRFATLEEIQLFTAKNLRDALDVIDKSDLYIPTWSTGYFDKNGTELFQGDIVETVYGTFGNVIFDNNKSAFIIKDNKENSLYACESSKIIGNIFESL